ncbi:MAG: CHAT domain-containing protein [Longimicrobiaceae bacterium]
MSKARLLFFAADPISVLQDDSQSPLQLDEDMREIQRRVRAATHRDALEFDWRFAARPEDLVQALRETSPQVVHFSGHGGKEGLVLVGHGGDPQPVSAAALKQLFQVFRGRIRLVVLNACLSLSQAKTIAEVVGCAIGTQREISEAAAITFGASFYSAIAFGHSVKTAFEQAVAELGMAHPGEEDCPKLVVREGVDPARLVLVSPPSRRRAGKAVAGVALTGAAVVAIINLVDPTPVSLAGQPDCGWGRGGGPPRMVMDPPRAPSAASTTGGGSSGGQSDLATAKVFYWAGNHAAALPLFKRAAEAGNPEAMGFLGIVLLRGQGTRPHPDSAIQWLRAAARKRDPRGMTALGTAYQYGQGVRLNLYLARHWYHEAADKKGWPEAMRNLASLYRDEGNYDSALLWYRNAAQAGLVDARVDAGRLYEEGRGVSQDLAEAQCLYRTAAEAKSPLGMYAMGRSYQEAIGVSRDYAEARKWYLKGVDEGSAEAMNAMGLLYQNGWGVPRDRAEAIRWYRMARDAGSKVAAGNLIALGVN